MCFYRSWFCLWRIWRWCWYTTSPTVILGGGGGYNGGGGGSDWNGGDWGHGGGGGSYNTGSNQTNITGIQYGNGLVIVSYSTQGCTGCTDPTALNYDSLALFDDGSCVYCTLSTSIMLMNATDSVSCDGVAFVNAYSNNGPVSYQWFDDNGNLLSSNNFVTNLCFGIYTLVTSDSLCSVIDTIVIGDIYGCNDPSAYNYDPLANTNDGSCCYISGCTDSAAFNYDVTACYDDGSCVPYIYGCTDINACNYDPSVNTDDGSCLTDYGCTDSSAFNTIQQLLAMMEVVYQLFMVVLTHLHIIMILLLIQVMEVAHTVIYR